MLLEICTQLISKGRTRQPSEKNLGNLEEQGTGGGLVAGILGIRLDLN